MIRKSLSFIFVFFCLSVLVTANNSTTRGPSVNGVLSASGLGNPANANTNDGLYSWGGLGVNGTNYTNWGFAQIPSNASIQGVSVQIEANASTATGTNSFGLRLGNGTAWGTAKDSGDLGTAPTNVSLGSASDTWGVSLNGVNISNFFLNITATTSATTRFVSLDFVTMNVTWIESNINFTTPTTNSSYGGYTSNFSVTVGTSKTLRNASFAWNATGANCDGGMSNITFFNPLSGTSQILNTSQAIPSTCIGKSITIIWWGNNTDGIVNTTTQTFTPGIPVNPGYQTPIFAWDGENATQGTEALGTGCTMTAINGSTNASDANLGNYFVTNRTGTKYWQTSSNCGFPSGNNNWSVSLWTRHKNNAETGNPSAFSWGTHAATCQQAVIEFNALAFYYLCFGDDYVGTTPLGDNVWEHWVTTYNSTNDTMYVYKNGALTESTGAVQTAITPTKATIGGIVQNGGFEWTGDIAQVYVYNITLKQADVQLLNNNQTGCKVSQFGTCVASAPQTPSCSFGMNAITNSSASLSLNCSEPANFTARYGDNWYEVIAVNQSSIVTNISFNITGLEKDKAYLLNLTKYCDGDNNCILVNNASNPIRFRTLPNPTTMTWTSNVSNISVEYDTPTLINQTFIATNITPDCTVQSYSLIYPTTLQNNLTAAYNFDNYLNDTAGSYHLTGTNTLAQGLQGQALNLTSLTQDAHISGAVANTSGGPDFNKARQVSMSFFVMPRSGMINGTRFWEVHEQGSFGYLGCYYDEAWAPWKGWSCSWGDGVSNSAHSIFPMHIAPENNTWYHIVVVFDKDSSYIDMWVNGVRGERLDNNSNWGSPTRTFTIGEPLAGGRSHIGLTDLTYVWMRNLSTDEINLLYNDGRGKLANFTYRDYQLNTATGKLTLANNGTSAVGYEKIYIAANDNCSNQLIQPLAVYVANISLNISKPTTASPASVSDGSKFTLNFTLARNGTTLTDNSTVNITGISIGGLDCPRTSEVVACFPTGGCQANCTAPTGLSGLQDVNITLIYTPENITVQANQTAAANYAVGDPCTVTCGTTTTADLNCNTLTITGSGVYQINHLVRYTTLKRPSTCKLSIRDGLGKLVH